MWEDLEQMILAARRRCSSWRGSDDDDALLFEVLLLLLLVLLLLFSISSMMYLRRSYESELEISTMEEVRFFSKQSFSILVLFEEAEEEADIVVFCRSNIFIIYYSLRLF